MFNDTQTAKPSLRPETHNSGGSQLVCWDQKNKSQGHFSGFSPEITGEKTFCSHLHFENVLIIHTVETANGLCRKLEGFLFG